MSVSPLTQPAGTAFFVVAAFAFGGCNSLLDNRPADTGEDLFHADPLQAQVVVLLADYQQAARNADCQWS